MALTRLKELVRTGQYAHAMREFLALMNANLTVHELATAYYLGSVARFKLDELHSALELGKLAEEYAGKVGDRDLLWRIWINMIEFYRRVGDTPQALDYGEKWLRSRDSRPPADEKYRVEVMNLESRVHYNLALVYRSRRDNRQCVNHFDQAVALMEHRPPAFKVLVHQMYAWVLYEIAKIEDGDRHAEKAQTLIDDDDVEAVREQLLLKCLRAFQIGDYTTVRALCEEFLTPGAVTTKAQYFWCAWMLGMSAAKLGEVRAAQAMAVVAMDAALKTGAPEHMNRACQLTNLVSRQSVDGEAG